MMALSCRNVKLSFMFQTLMSVAHFCAESFNLFNLDYFMFIVPSVNMQLIKTECVL